MTDGDAADARLADPGGRAGDPQTRHRLRPQCGIDVVDRRRHRHRAVCPGPTWKAAVAELVDDSGLDEIDMAFAATGDAGVMLYLLGDVFGEIDGRRVEPEAGLPFEQTIQWPFMGVGLFVGDAAADPVGHERFALVGGVVPASGARVHSPEVSGATAFYERRSNA